ncbi:carboxypeptidase regulatory-like domain-containing protein [Bergeyella porcorum]
MTKKLTLIPFLTVLSTAAFYAQTTVFGYLKDSNGAIVERAEVELKGVGGSQTADKIGYFQFVDVMPGNYQLVITKPNYETKVIDFAVSEDEKRKNLGVVSLLSSLSSADLGVALLDNTVTDDEATTQSSLSVLQSSRDVFSSLASYDLGFYWFRPRGIDGRLSETMMNGISMAKQTNGFIDFGNWGGLNEITRYPEIAVNHAPSEYAFGGVGSVIYKNTKASEYRKGSQLTYSLTNRNYRNRLSYRFSSGMSKSGWAFTGMIARRWAEEGIQEGTFYDAYGAYLGVEKRVNSNRTLTFNVIGAPYRRSTASPNTQEVYNYRGVHYNSYWGYQNGEKRSERVRENFQPMFQLSDYWKISDKTSLWTSVSYQFGKNRSSRLDWFRVQNPSPTYYRRLPSYFLSQLENVQTDNLTDAELLNLRSAYNQAVDAWSSGDPSVTQINWDLLYQRNQLQPEGEYYGVTGRRALYFMVDDVTDDKIWNVNTHLTHDFSDRTRFFLNVAYQNYFSNQYREVKDLLGADFALNIDPFAATNNPGTSGQFNEGETNVTKRVGDRIGYDYNYGRQEVRVNPALKVNLNKFDVFVSGLFGYSTSYREGNFKHFLYQRSGQRSKNHEFLDYGLKGQVTYKIDGRNFLVYNGAYFSKAPFLEDLFINPRLSNTTAPNIKNTVVNANDLSYVLASPFVKMRLTGFLVDTQNDTTTQRFFADGIQLTNVAEDGTAGIVQSAFVTEVMSNVEKRNMGAELGLEVKITPTLTFQGLANYGEYTYRNNPNVYFVSEAVARYKDGLAYEEFGKSYLKGYRQGGTPQMAFSAGLRYNSPKYYWLGVNWNYLDHNYLDPAALLRTENFVNSAYTGTPYANITEAELRRVLAQYQLPSAHFVNVNAGKSWLIGKYYVLVSATVNNVLNNKNYITSGFEQTRNTSYQTYVQDFDRENSLFAPKFWYTQGRSYFVNLQFRF